MERVVLGVNAQLSYHLHNIANGGGRRRRRRSITSTSTTRCHYTCPSPPPPALSPATPRPTTSLSSSSFNPLPLRYSSFGGGDSCNGTTMEKNKGRGLSSVCHAGPFLSYPANLNWISAIASLALMLTKGTAINKSFIVPLFALLAPTSVISWFKGEYGMWTAFLALLVRLFFFIPGELELPLMALLLIIVSPYQVMDLRGMQAGAIIALALAVYLAFQHFSRIGNFKQAFEQGSLVATLAIACLTVVSIMLLI